jgi:hypothetical protein
MMVMWSMISQQICGDDIIIVGKEDKEEAKIRNDIGAQSYIIKLPQPQPRMRAYTHTGQRALRATQVRSALSYVYATTYQNRITDIL